MDTKEYTENFSFLEYINFIRSVISIYETGQEKKYFDIKSDLLTLEEKINDSYLYLGVVGSFSSGKSTFINSMIHKNLLPTDAVQGTTVVASILKRADFDDLKITYVDDKVEKLSEIGNDLFAKYKIPIVQPDIKIKESIFIRILNWIKKMLGFKTVTENQTQSITYDNRILLFKTIISTEELAESVKSVTLFYKNSNIPHRIALVDTPGTDSLNKRHNKVTKNAVDNICDAIVVIIPYDEPVSEDLLEYVNNNLGEHKDECIFVVTKVELIGDIEELPRLLRVIKKRLENGLMINSACVIPMPTLIYLKAVDTEMQTTFLSDISEEDKSEFISMYENGIQKINEILEEKRNSYIKRKIINTSKKVRDKLNSNLSDEVNNYDDINKLLQEETVEPLVIFENEIEYQIKELNRRNKQGNIGVNSFIKVQFLAFLTQMEAEINNCSDSQQLLSKLDFASKDTFDEILTLIKEYFEDIVNGMNSKLNEFEMKYHEEYSKCNVSGHITKITMDLSDFFTSNFLRENEDLLQSTLSEIKSTIRNETTGFFKKVKSFFSNPINKHKELAIVKLSDVVDQLIQTTTDFVQETLNGYYDILEQNMINSIKCAIDNDRNAIENYIDETDRAISYNAEKKQITLDYISKLNNYIKNMEEVNQGE